MSLFTRMVVAGTPGLLASVDRRKYQPAGSRRTDDRHFDPVEHVAARGERGPLGLCVSASADHPRLVRHGERQMVLAAARADPDAQPLTDAQLKRMKRTGQTKFIRGALGMTQEEFAESFGIPIATLRDWEQDRVEPDEAARSYLKVIARNPNAVRKALKSAA
jgi:putative transcriptional regulator